MGYSFTARSGSVLYVEDIGSGPPVLALHGIGGGTYFFRGVAKRLASSHRVLSIDLPGTGNSASAQTPTLESWIADIGDLVAGKVGEPVVLLGHSLGTILALKAWETWPERIRALLFTCGLPQARPNIRERLSARAESIAQSGIAGWGEKVSPGVFSPETMKNLPEMVGMFERLFEEQEPGSYVRSIEILLGADLNAVVPTVTVPCAAIVGGKDSYAPPEAVEAFTARLPVPCPRTVLETCAHMPFFEAPEAYAAAAENFLRSV